MACLSKTKEVSQAKDPQLEHLATPSLRRHDPDQVLRV